MKSLITTLLIIMSLPATIIAEERPVAFMKAQYTEWHKSNNKKDEKPYVSEYKYVLQIGNGESYYYDPQTFFVDSLDSNPTGRAIYDQAFHDAMEDYRSTGKDVFASLKEKGLMAEGRYKNQKDFQTKLITVWDSNGADKYQYDVDMNDLNWEICDSTITVLNYECFLATAEYHGRTWDAWFAPEIPVQDGPWQLCGLPGLIMKAKTEDGEYGFEITGLQQCNETFKPTMINPDKLFKTNRKSYLKQKDYGRRNRSAHISAMTGGKVKVNADYKGTDDFLETDYHE